MREFFSHGIIFQCATLSSMYQNQVNIHDGENEKV